MPSEHMRRLMEQAAAMVERAPLARDKEHSVDYDSFDKLAWEMLRDNIPLLQRSERSMSDTFPYVRPAYQDLFNIFFQDGPEFRDLNRMKPGYADNHPMLEHLRGTDEVEHLRKQTVFNEYETAFSMLEMEKKLREEMEKVQHKREMRDRAQELLEELLEKIRNGEPLNLVPGGEAGDEVELTPEQEAELQAALQAAMGDLENKESDLAEAMAAAGDEVGKEAAAISETLTQDKANASMFGFEDGDLKHMNYEERRKLAESLNVTAVTRLVDLVGGWQRNADAERRRPVSHSPGSKTDVRLSNDVTRLMDAEYVNLVNDDLEDLFWARYASHELLTWEETDLVKAGRGRIMVIGDESHSMNTKVAGDVTREMWCKALVLTMADQAKRKKRDFTYIGFSSVNQVWTRTYPKGQIGVRELIELVTHQFDGGTHYLGVLEAAKKIMDDDRAKGLERPDIVFATDDACSVAEDYCEKWQKWRDREKVTMYGIQIGTRTSNALHKLSDKVVNLTELNAGTEGMNELFRTL